MPTVDWDAVVDRASPATRAEMAKELADASEVSSDETHDAVESAIDAGELVDDDGEGMFPTFEVASGANAGVDVGSDSHSEQNVEEDHENDGDTHGGLPSYTRLFAEARGRAGTEPYEPVPDKSVREAFGGYALDSLVDPQATDEGKPPQLAFIDGWVRTDLADAADDETDVRWYHATGDEPRPDEFRRFHELLTANTPDGYVPHYFRVEAAVKAPATEFGSWKADGARLTVEEAVEWMEQGGNVGIAGRGDPGDEADDVTAEADALVNLDIDDDEETTPEDHPTTLRAVSRSRAGYHGWYFNPEGDIPNIPTDEAGEIRTDWQYVVAPGSFVATANEELPDDAGSDAGYYTVEEEAPVASLEYDDLPEVFREFHEQVEAEQEQTSEHYDEEDPRPGNIGVGGGGDAGGAAGGGESDSAVFDVSAKEVLRKNGGQTTGRFSAVFHNSSTSANMSLSNQGKIHCWRHQVAHGGLQALAALSDHGPTKDTACRQIGKGHKNSGIGPNKYKGDPRLVLWAWCFAKNNGHIPDDDPIPRRALQYVARENGFSGDLVEIEVGDGSFPALPNEAYNNALDAVSDEYGVNHGRYPVGGEGASNGGHAEQFIEECEPPTTADADPLDVRARRNSMTGELYDAYTEDDSLTVWAHNPGEGKTTSAGLAAADRDRDHVALLPKHENCREFQRDDAKPDGYFHLKGAEQPRHDECMDADIDERDCDEHGHPSNCPTMCPIYTERDSDDRVRKLWDALVGAVGVRKAHVVLDLSSRDWHGEECAWERQWERLETADRVVTVHQYAPLKTVRDHGDIIVDDLQGALSNSNMTKLDSLARCAQALRTFATSAGEDRTAVTLRKLAEFVDDLSITLSEGDPTTTTLDDVSVPSFPDSYTRRFDSREDVPEDVPDDSVEETTQREYVGQGSQYVERHAVKAQVTDLAEVLAQAKRHYNDTLMTRMRNGRWSDTPLCLDSVLAALAAAGADTRACRIAAGTPAVLDDCPRCTSELGEKNGQLVCGECGWNEEHGRLTSGSPTPARIDAETADGPEGIHGVATRRYPAVSDLPDPARVLVLDATPQVKELAALFGGDPDTVTVEGNDAYSLPNTNVTQFVDGAYHRSTIEDSDVAQQRIQRAVNRINDMHDDVLFITMQKCHGLIDWPDDSEVMSYHALRGLDRDDDAVVCIGAPHPDEDDLKADARVLSDDNPRIRTGGTELSTRTESADPVYRKLNFTDDDGGGRAVASKTYKGLVGDLFDGLHSDEIEQAAHRIRPILADESNEKHVYLLTNVATELPVDRLVGYDAFLNPVEHQLDVRDSALGLLDTVTTVAKEADSDTEYAADGGVITVGTTGSEWHEAAQDGGMDVSRSTVTRALDDLKDGGLVTEGGYEQDRGRILTVTELGARVATR